MSRDAWARYSARGSWYFEVTAPGFKYNMTDLQAALGLCQLKRLKDFIMRREVICGRYDEAFSDVSEIRVPTISPDVRSSRYIYPVLLEQERLRIGRDQFIEALKAEKIGTSVHYIPAHLHPYYQKEFGYRRGDFPVTEFVFDRLVCLPLFPSMSDEEIETVIAAVRRLIAYYRR
jgi:dTDP-4-amino-4,6-dideoxygalactose transaminase